MLLAYLIHRQEKMSQSLMELATNPLENLSFVSQIEVSQVRSRADRNAFIRFPWRIYENDHAWVPPLIIERKAFFDRKRPTLFTNTATPHYFWRGKMAK